MVASRDPKRATKARVLVVDDDPGIRLLLCHMLTDLGYEAGEAEDGLRALELVRAARWDLVITDQRMPRMSGTALARSLRDNGDHIPVVLLTGHAPDLPSADVAGLGIVEVIQKPCPVSQIAAAVHAALDTHPRKGRS